MGDDQGAFACPVRRALTALCPQGPMAVAVSGGPDSMALAHGLFFLKDRNFPVTALIVDHQLRPESGQEALLAQQTLQGFGMTAHILPWHGPKPPSRLQERARQARHDLLSTWCRQHHVPYLFLGHHGDDQEETRLMRLLRGSYLPGLEAMTPQVPRDFGMILRPFLSLTKQHLVAYCHAHDLAFIRDPSNTSRRFLRSHVRRFLLDKPPGYVSQLVPPHTLATTMTQWVGRYLWHHGDFRYEENTVHQLTLQGFFSLPPSFQSFLLGYVIQHGFGHSHHGPSGSWIDNLLKSLQAPHKKVYRKEMKFEKKNDALVIRRL